MIGIEQQYPQNNYMYYVVDNVCPFRAIVGAGVGAVYLIEKTKYTNETDERTVLKLQIHTLYTCNKYKHV